MRRMGFVCALTVAIGGYALAQSMSEEMQQKAAAAKAAAARNQQALRSYSWITKTELSFKGEVKNTKIESCQYGPDGQVHKTELSEPPPPPEKKRGLRGKVVAKKTGEMKAELESAAALAHSYVPPSPEKIQAVIAPTTPIASRSTQRWLLMPNTVAVPRASLHGDFSRKSA